MLTQHGHEYSHKWSAGCKHPTWFKCLFAKCHWAIDWRHLASQKGSLRTTWKSGVLYYSRLTWLIGSVSIVIDPGRLWLFENYTVPQRKPPPKISPFFLCTCWIPSTSPFSSSPGELNLRFPDKRHLSGWRVTGGEEEGGGRGGEGGCEKAVGSKKKTCSSSVKKRLSAKCPPARRNKKIN